MESLIDVKVVSACVENKIRAMAHQIDAQMEFVNAEIKIPVELLVNNASLEHVCVELHQAAKARAQARFAILRQVSANVHKTQIPVQTEWNVTTVIAVMV